MSFPGGSIPHQIPFRALSRIHVVGERSARGCFMISASDALLEGREVPAMLLIEAMAQLAGAIVYGSSSAPAMLSAIDRVRFEQPPVVGDSMQLDVELEVSFGSMHRFTGQASIGDRRVAVGTFVLASAEGDA